MLLTCRLEGKDACLRSPSFCRMDMPETPGAAPLRSSLLLREGVFGGEEAVARYRYAGEGLASCDCSMAISWPLRDEDEGVWRCVFGFDKSRVRGGLLHVIAGNLQGRLPHTNPRGVKLMQHRVQHNLGQ